MYCFVISTKFQEKSLTANFLFYMVAEYQERKKQRKRVETNSISNFLFHSWKNKRNSPVQHCWELSHLAKSLTGFKLCATTPNNMQQDVQTDATCNIQQFWELLANNVTPLARGLKGKTKNLYTIWSLNNVIKLFTIKSLNTWYILFNNYWTRLSKISSFVSGSRSIEANN